MLAARELARAAAIVFYNDSAYTGTISVIVGPHEDSDISTFLPLNSNGSAVVLTAAVVQRWDINGFEALAIKTSGTEGSTRTVDVYAIVDVGI